MAGKVKKGKKGFQSVEEGGVHTGTEAWNIAQYFTGYSIALPLRYLNDLEDIARFGSLKMDEDVFMPDDHFVKKRAEGVERYWVKIKQIIEDTKFKVRAGDKDEARELKAILTGLPKFFDKLIIIRNDEVSHEDDYFVNEDLLISILDILVGIKVDYLHILDRAGLIFREVDEVDLDKMVREFTEGG